MSGQSADGGKYTCHCSVDSWNSLPLEFEQISSSMPISTSANNATYHMTGLQRGMQENYQP
jgi:hypothetical protein